MSIKVKDTYVRNENGQLVKVPFVEGVSAYDSAVIGGYTGTETEFYQKLSDIETKADTDTKINTVKSQLVAHDDLDGSTIKYGADGKVHVIGGGSSEDFEQKLRYIEHKPVLLGNVNPFGTNNKLWDICVDGDVIYAVNGKTTNPLMKATVTNDNKWTVTKKSPLPTGTDSTDKPTDMTEFANSGSGWICRNIANGSNYLYISARVGSGFADNVHLYGGIVCVKKSDFSIEKSYWTKELISRTVLNNDGTLLAAACQMSGIRFYSVNGSTLTEKKFFAYDQSSGSATKTCESQNGCFYTDGTNKYYFNCGFSGGFIIYDVTDVDNITQVKIYKPTDLGLSKLRTYTSVVDYPYAYITSANNDGDIKDNIAGVITLDISDSTNITIVKSTYINHADLELYNNDADKKPTEMKRMNNTLITNYEYGFLLFDISEKGNPKYCGKYFDDGSTESKNKNNGIGVSNNGSGRFYVGFGDGHIDTFVGTT